MKASSWAGGWPKRRFPMRDSQFARFVVAGGLAALANIGARVLLGHFLSYVASIVIAYCIGMATAFLLNRWLVFRDPGNSVHHQVAWFIAVNLAAVAQTVAISLLLARIVFPHLGMRFHPETVGHVIGVLAPVFTSYLGHKHLTFRTANE